MKLSLYCMDLEFDGPSVSAEGTFEVKTTGTPNIFTKDFILDALVAGTKSGELKNWIDLERVEESRNTARDVDIDELTLEMDDFYNERFGFPDRCYLRITPETTAEYECYFNIKLDNQYPNHPRNGVSILPRWRILEDTGSKIAGSIIILGHSDTGIRRDDPVTEYWFILRIIDLYKPEVNVHASKKLIPHLIGKQGRNIKWVMERLHNLGFKKVRRINLIESEYSDKEAE